MEAVGKIRGSGLIPSEIFKMMETSQGPADVRPRAQMAFYTAYSILDELEQREQQAQGGASTSAPATTSIRSPKAAPAAIASRAAASRIRCAS